MKISKDLVLELKQILKEEFNFDLKESDVEKLGYSLIGYFDLLAKIRYKHEVRK